MVLLALTNVSLKTSKTTIAILKKLLSNQPFDTDVALLLLRVIFGLLLANHGLDKLHYLIQGQSADFPDPLHIGPRASHILTVWAEFFCSILLMLGLYTRVALLFLMGCMAVITLLMADNFGDREHPLMYLMVFVALFLTGSGKYSVDAQREK